MMRDIKPTNLTCNLITYILRAVIHIADHDKQNDDADVWEQKHQHHHVMRPPPWTPMVVTITGKRQIFDIPCLRELVEHYMTILELKERLCIVDSIRFCWECDSW